MTLNLTRHQYVILGANTLLIVAFALVFLSRRNYEVLAYVGTTIVVVLVILYSNRALRYPSGLLWWLTLWALLHFAGGGLIVNGVRLYNLILIPLTADVIRYDQVVHAIGLGAATYFMYYLLTHIIEQPVKSWGLVAIMTIAAGLGIGAFNEIVEFIASRLIPDTHVGDNTNTALDLVADGIGSAIAFCIIYWRERRAERPLAVRTNGQHAYRNTYRYE